MKWNNATLIIIGLILGFTASNAFLIWLGGFFVGVAVLSLIVPPHRRDG